MKRFVFWVITYILMLIVVAVFAEGLLRIFRGHPHHLREITQQQNATLLEPNRHKEHVSSVEGEFAYFSRTNAFGYRGEEFEMPKPDDVIRIFAVGDSFTFGVGADEDETIPALLQKRLRERNIPAEVINAGIGHSGPVKHYINIRDIHLKYEPDVVLLLLDLTDLWDDWQSERHALYGPDGEIRKVDMRYVNGRRDRGRWLMEHSALARYLNDKLYRTYLKIRHLGLRDYVMAKLKGDRAKAVIIRDNDVPDDVQIQYDGLLMARGQVEEALIRKHWKRTAKYLLKIRNLLESRGIPLVLVMYPHGIYVGPDQWKNGREPWGFETGTTETDYFAFDLVSDWAREQNIPFINTLPAFLEEPDEKYFFDWDGHMTPAGNHIVARELASSPRILTILRGQTGRPE